jgi:prephenate dehydrogenase
MKIRNIGFIGFGLIGGSIARAIKAKYPEYTITVTSRSLDALYIAQSEGVVDVVATSVNEDFSHCDYIFLCTPVITITQYLKAIKKVKNSTCIITDVGSVKEYIHNAVIEENLEDCFIGGHPMAGSEQTGYVNSSSTLVQNAKYVITPTAKTTPAQLKDFSDLIKDMGAIPIVMDYKQHDVTVAAISHMPHLLAATLTNFVQDHDDKDKHMHQLAAGGFKDMTRIASSSPEMWEQICSANANAISDTLTAYIDTLTQLRDQINNQQNGYITNLFNQSGSYRDTFSDVDNDYIE